MSEVIRTKTDTKPLNKIYGDADDKYVNNVVLYGKTVEGVNGLYADAAATQGVTTEDVKDLFKKGILTINVEGALFAPVAFADSAVVTLSVEESTVVATSWVGIDE